MPKLKVAVIGVGNIGQHHARIYHELSSATLTAIADPRAVVGRRLAQQYQTRYYSDYKEMLQYEKLDLISICVPTSLHAQIGMACLEQGVGVIVEKPIATTVAQAEKLIKRAHQLQVPFTVGHLERFNPAVLAAKKLLMRGTLGEITSMYAQRMGPFPRQITDSDVVSDLAIHDIDLANYFMDELPQKYTSNKQLFGSLDRIDSVDFYLTYKRASVYLQANWLAPFKRRTWQIIGTKGLLDLDLINRSVTLHTKKSSKIIPIKLTEPLANELKSVVHWIQHQQPLANQFAVEALKIATK